ncbi:dihydroxyacetone kinase subunit DhaL [Streptomyces sp. TRM 70361]|uniref:dihydroxyacetone kinase subunit DhaL n=1 Tax=Streptomyces sp. TRM 70361 TaxID=3116553 RepID=UPI002E7B3CB2|nr:dihydroxyacetone kinase subunit DhaL [Streptomyces sp. TRM 70361]MEE1940832.1 dihydroxyacetone kinase subunit DhaL [Streptomyces sp. TRM 70361]
MSAAAAAVAREERLLTELDSAIGDADHGGNLRRGFTAVLAALDEEAPAAAGTILALAGQRLISTVGGASGPLYGTLLRRTGKALGDGAAVDAVRLRDALREGVDAVARLGSAARGDKTMLDALYPAVEALDGSAGSFRAARAAAEEGAAATVPMRARRGRASYLGERSVGHQDPGATSAALLFAALAETADTGSGGAGDHGDSGRAA